MKCLTTLGTPSMTWFPKGGKGGTRFSVEGAGSGNIIISSNDEPDEPGHLPKKGTAFRQFQIRGSEHLPKGEPEHLPKQRIMPLASPQRLNHRVGVG